MTMLVKALQVDEVKQGKVLEVQVTGRLEKSDYEEFVPEVERRIRQHGRIRVLFRMRDFKGWTAGALWEDFTFDVKHFNDIERIAFVGERKWEEGMALFCKPFTTARIRYFDSERLDEAREWIEAD